MPDETGHLERSAIGCLPTLHRKIPLGWVCVCVHECVDVHECVAVYMCMGVCVCA
jgi:hypothetical protein